MRLIHFLHQLADLLLLLLRYLHWGLQNWLLLDLTCQDRSLRAPSSSYVQQGHLLHHQHHCPSHGQAQIELYTYVVIGHALGRGVEFQHQTGQGCRRMQPLGLSREGIVHWLQLEFRQLTQYSHR